MCNVKIKIKVIAQSGSESYFNNVCFVVFCMLMLITFFIFLQQLRNAIMLYIYIYILKCVK